MVSVVIDGGFNVRLPPIKYNNATQLSGIFFHNQLNDKYLSEINIQDIKKITIIENAEVEDIILPSYKMVSIVVYLLSRDGRVDSWIIDLGLAKQQGRTPESLIQGLVMTASTKMIMVTKSASRRNDSRLTFIEFNVF